MAATLTEKSIPKLSPKDKPFEIFDRGGKESVRELLIRVQPTGAKNYYVQIARGKRERLGSVTTYTLARARNEARKLLGKAADGHDFQEARQRKRTLKDTTLGSYLEGPFKTHAESQIASHRDMLSRIAKAFHHILDKPMTEITELDMAKWRRERSSVSLETQRRELSYLKALLNHAIDSKAIPSHQLQRYRVKGTLEEGEKQAKIRYLLDDEEVRLRAALDNRSDHIKPIVLVALNTGLRRGDLFGLKWEHVDLERRQIRKIIEKTSHSRRKAGLAPQVATLPLSNEAAAILRELYKARKDSPLVFPSPVSGGRLDNIKKAFASVLAEAHIENFRFHDLRHTFASRLVMAGVDINTVRELMTHSDIKMTLVYAHLSPDHKAAALDRAFGGAK